MEASGDMAEAVFIAKEINRQVGGMDMLDTVHGFARESERSQRVRIQAFVESSRKYFNLRDL